MLRLSVNARLVDFMRDRGVGNMPANDEIVDREEISIPHFYLDLIGFNFSALARRCCVLLALNSLCPSR